MRKKVRKKSKKIIKEKLRQILCQPWDRIFKFYGGMEERDFRAGQLVSKQEIEDFNIKEKFLEIKGKEKAKIYKGNTEEFILAENIGKEKIQMEDKMEQEILEKVIEDVDTIAKNYLEGGSMEGLAKTALEAIREIAEITEKSRKGQFIKK